MPKRESSESTKKRYSRVRQRQSANRKLVADIKMKRGCVDCGYNAHSEALHFDHINPDLKTGRVSTMLSQVRFNRILEEIAKCEVRCANCHAVKTMRDMDHRRRKDAFFDHRAAGFKPLFDPW